MTGLDCMPFRAEEIVSGIMENSATSEAGLFVQSSCNIGTK